MNEMLVQVVEPEADDVESCVCGHRLAGHRSMGPGFARCRYFGCACDFPIPLAVCA